MKLKVLGAGFATMLALAAFATAAAKAPDDSGNPKKEYVCHFTGSTSNPVVLVNVGNSAVNAHTVKPGHGHQGDDASSDARPDDLSNCDSGGGEG